MRIPIDQNTIFTFVVYTLENTNQYFKFYNMPLKYKINFCQNNTHKSKYVYKIHKNFRTT